MTRSTKPIHWLSSAFILSALGLSACSQAAPRPTSVPTPLAQITPSIAFTAVGLSPVVPEGTPVPTSGTSGQIQQVSARQTRQSPSVVQADLDQVVAGNTVFAFDLYQKLRSQAPTQSLFYSPYSISTALAMTYAGARGQTAEQMSNTLHFTLSPERLHPALNALDLRLIPLSPASKPTNETQSFRLNIANALWGQQDYAFHPTFLDTLALNYGAGLQLVNFKEQTEAARTAINDWVSQQTQQKIKDLIPSGALSSDSRLVLTNAIYFKADWMHQFEPDSTIDDTFYLLDDSTTTVPMMHQKETFRYAIGRTYEAVSLPYSGGSTEMLIIVPKSGSFEQVDSTLDAQMLNTVLADLQPAHLDLFLPRFRYESGSIELGDLLAALGMQDAFTEKADFSGMSKSEQRELFISKVIHKAFIAVDENGTEAAAATGVIMGVTSAAPQESTTLKIDRPFIFLIRDTKTGSILFVGRILSPSNA